MLITQVTVGWQETVSLPEYNNVRPALSLTATVDEAESAELVARDLLAHCKLVCRREVDEALEAYGRRPRWFAGQRYQVVQGYRAGAILIMPNEVELDAARHRWTHVFGIERGMSRSGAERWVRERYSGERIEIIDDVLEAERRLGTVKGQDELPF